MGEGGAFLVMLRENDGRLIGGGCFQYSKDEGLYAVGAYDRSLFDEPVSHIVQITAIEHLLRLGLKRYRLGRRPYPGDPDHPQDKDLSIGYFKEGFATHMSIELMTSLPASEPADQIAHDESVG